MKSFFGKHFLLLVLALFAAKIDRSAAFAGKGGGEFDISQWICGTENTNTIVQAVCDFGWAYIQSQTGAGGDEVADDDDGDSARKLLRGSESN